MTVGIAGDSPTTTSATPSPAATSDQQPASTVQLTAEGLVTPTGTIDRAREDGVGRVLTSDPDYLQAILMELRTLTAMVAEGLNVQTDPDGYREAMTGDVLLN